jgi:hypothetical protein
MEGRVNLVTSPAGGHLTRHYLFGGKFGGPLVLCADRNANIAIGEDADNLAFRIEHG